MSKRKVKRCPLEFKESSAKLAVESSQSIAKTARDLGGNDVSLRGWVRKYYNRQDTTDMPVSDETLAEELKL